MVWLGRVRGHYVQCGRSTKEASAPWTSELRWCHMLLVNCHKAYTKLEPHWSRQWGWFGGRRACTASCHLLLIRLRQNWYHPMEWICAAYAWVSKKSAGHREPKVDCQDRQSGGKSGSNQSRKPSMMTRTTCCGVSIATKLLSSFTKASLQWRMVVPKEQWTTCSKVLSSSPQPGQRSEVPYRRQFCLFVLDRLWTSLEIPIHWKRMSLWNARWWESQSTPWKVAIVQPVFRRILSINGCSWCTRNKIW